MSLFSQEVFLKEIRALMPTQEKIKTLALYMRALAASSTKMVQILDKEFEASNCYHKLNIFYLANELILNIKKTDPEQALLLEQMTSFVLIHFQEAKKEMVDHPALKSKLDDLKTIWYDRKIFTPETLGEESKKVSFAKPPTKTIQSPAPDKINSKTVPEFQYTKEEIHTKVDEFFEAKKSLANYLDGMLKRLKKSDL